VPEIATDTLVLHRGDPVAVAELLGLPGVVLSGHFKLLSGLHADRFIAFSRIADEPGALGLVAGWLSPSLATLAPTGVIAPSTAGVGLGWALARRLGVAMQLASLDEHGRPDGIIGGPDMCGERLVLVNDVVTTGTGLAALATTVRGAGGEVAAAAWFASRRPVDVGAAVGAPVVSIADVDMPCCTATECPACAAGEPVTPALDLN
jgi:orotate phosphoribosyltransferase